MQMRRDYIKHNNYHKNLRSNNNLRLIEFWNFSKKPEIFHLIKIQIKSPINTSGFSVINLC